MFAVLMAVALLAQQPQPFPRPGTAQPSQPKPAPPPPATPSGPSTATPAGQPKPAGAPTEAMLGVPIYPGAQFITSYDQGGIGYISVSRAFVDLVIFLTALKQKGEPCSTCPLRTVRRRQVPRRIDGVSARSHDQDYRPTSRRLPDRRRPASSFTLIQIVPVTEKP
jgi:hypothetical protein